MPLVQTSLKQQIKNLSKQMVEFEDQDEAIDHYADELSKIITDYIKTATVTVQAGQVVQTVPTTGTGSTTSPGTGTLS